MTDQEINEAVAKKLGWIEDISFGTRIGWMQPGSVKLLEPNFVMATGFAELPNYSTDIAAAWEIVELKQVTSFLLGKHLEVKFVCRLGTENGFFDSDADTAPLAICLAFLKLEDI